MKDKTIEAAREMIDMLATQDDTHVPVDPKVHPLQYMFQTVWHRFQAVSSTLPPSGDLPEIYQADQSLVEKSFTGASAAMEVYSQEVSIRYPQTGRRSSKEYRT